MEAMVERACGLDVHQRTVVACVLVGAAGARASKEVRTFGTTVRELELLREWLSERGVTHVGMESTGVYWKPVYAVLEGSFELIVGNAHHISRVPGRKTDVRDAEWIADLVRHGLVAKSFVPPKDIRELRELTRFRHALVRTRADERNRLLKLLETANIKLSSVATNVFGKSGMAMLRAIARGEQSPEVLASLARGLLRKKHGALQEALHGRIGEHHRLLLNVQIGRLDALESDVKVLDDAIAQRMAPYASQQRALEEIPGIGAVSARAIVAEIGADMSAFPDEHHLAAWIGICPGNHESAGKRMAGTSRKGNALLRGMLVEAALAGVRTKGSYFRAKYFRLKSRCGAKRAIVAVAHKIAIAIYRLLADGTVYRDLGEGYLDALHKTRTTKHLVRRLETLGFHVQLQPTSAGA